MIRKELEAAVQAAKEELQRAEAELYKFDSAPENNAYTTLEAAVGSVEDKLLSQAQDDCEGSYNCGAEEYTQEFVVNGKHYIGTLKCDYNRHDKMYYYIDGYDFTYEEVIRQT